MSIPKVSKFNTTVSPTWCNGCGNYGIWAAVKAAFVELRLESHQIFMVYDIGCNGNGSNFTKTYAFHTLHGRPLPVAVGAKLGNKDLIVLAIAGDGGAYGEGIQHFLHAARYNIDITFLVHDNRRFSLTTGQSSPTSFRGSITKTTPYGEFKKPINPLLLSLDSGASFVARGFAGEISHLTKLIKAGIEHKGFSHIDILQQCVAFNHDNSLDWYKKVVYKLEDHKYRVDNLNKARLKAEEFEKTGKLPIGLLYKNRRVTYGSYFSQLDNEPLSMKDLTKINCLK